MKKFKALHPSFLNLDDLASVKDWLIQNKDKSNVDKCISFLADNAIYNNKIGTLKLLTEHGYDLLTVRAEDGSYLPHHAASLGRNEVLSYLATLGSLEIKSDLMQLTPLYVAMHAGHKDCVEHLLKLGCRVDTSMPIINKVSIKALEELLKNVDEKSLNMAELLKSNGFEPNLDFYIMGMSAYKFDFIDFSNTSMVSSVISLPDNSKVFFENSNLKNAAINNLITSESVNFTGANLDGLSGVIEKSYYEALKKELTGGADHLIPINRDSYFKQYYLIKANDIRHERVSEEPSPGVCKGLVIEYGRSIIRNTQKNADGDLDQKFIDKLKRNCTNDSNTSKSIVGRVAAFQEKLQNYATQEISLNSSKDFFDSILDNFPNSTLLQFESPEHAMAIRVMRDTVTNSVEGYKFFDPNFGIFPMLNGEEFFQEVCKLRTYYEKVSGFAQFKLSAGDLSTYLEKVGLVSANESDYNKDSKKLDKLFQALKDNDVETITKLSALQKIDYHHSYSSLPDEIELIDGATLREDNPLKFAIYKSSEDALIALISNNSKLDLTEQNCIVILTHLILANKNSEAALEALSKKADELGCAQGKQLFDTVLSMKQSGDFSWNSKHCYELCITTKPQNDKAKEMVDVIVENLEHNNVDISVHSTQCNIGENATVLHSISIEDAIFI